jgi:hypothetical protein
MQAPAICMDQPGAAPVRQVKNCVVFQDDEPEAPTPFRSKPLRDAAHVISPWNRCHVFRAGLAFC